MKIIQTYWNARSENFDQAKCGWLTPETHWMAWALSCTLLRRFYDDVELYTTEKDAEIFRQFNIPYTKIHTSLDCDFIKNLEPSMWAYAKIYTYSLQEEPFLHVDGDVFIWEAFNQSLFSGDICVQNVEENLEVYHKSIETLLNTEGAFIPEWIYENKDYPIAFNMGIFGSNNIPFVKEYCNIAFEYYEKNKSLFSQMHKTDPNVNILPEQYLLYDISKKKNKITNLFYNNPIKESKDFSIFARYEDIPHKNKYIHFLSKFKFISICNEFIYFVLKQENPKCWDLISNQNTTNIYYHLKDINKDLLTEPFLITKDAITTRNYCENSIFHTELDRIRNIQKNKINYTYKHIKGHLFPSYIKGYHNLKNKCLHNKYLNINPNHSIVISNIDFETLFKNDLIINKKFYNPKINFSILYQDILGFHQLLWLNEFTIPIFEQLKMSPLKVKDIIYVADNKIFNIINDLYLHGLFFLSDSPHPITNYSEDIAKYKQNSEQQARIVISNILNKNGKNIDKNTINISNNSFFSIYNYLKANGYNVQAFKCNIKNIDTIEIPFITLINKKPFPILIIIEEISEKFVTIFNPISCCTEKYERDYIENCWTENIITIIKE